VCLSDALVQSIQIECASIVRRTRPWEPKSADPGAFACVTQAIEQSLVGLSDARIDLSIARAMTELICFRATIDASADSSPEFSIQAFSARLKRATKKIGPHGSDHASALRIAARRRSEMGNGWIFDPDRRADGLCVRVSNALDEVIHGELAIGRCTWAGKA